MIEEGQEVGAAWKLHTAGLDAELYLPYTLNELFMQMRKALIQASNQRQLTNPIHSIHASLKRIPKSERRRTESVILGGDKNFQRVKDTGLKYFERNDGAWFDFALTLKESPRLTLIAYNFELRFPEELAARFIRFDLNPPDHANEERGLRAHMHPGSDDILVPYFIMDPLELLKMMIYEFRVARPELRT